MRIGKHVWEKDCRAFVIEKKLKENCLSHRNNFPLPSILESFLRKKARNVIYVIGISHSPLLAFNLHHAAGWGFEGGCFADG